ncbi:PaaI family thioesterase [Methanosphaerula palustris]|uniref:Thioesterase superfamily protein n=1 Tax=Methanosphaerula palustris (strain ATCC BAA-1556 / DSM 19958 / E1-9c) TaxID=521011 RepID=B8GIB4_METPE|nr:PaaI family thioesterase [Methanosphaerula palustris]ACL15465.1 thioesterase superfamily protein [Methanosphaerula palustris E1-9c]
MNNYCTALEQQGAKANPFFTLMGIEVVAMEEGHGELSMVVRPDMLNGEGWLQGGLYTALADEAIVLAIYPGLQEREGIATISATTDFFHGVNEGTIVARGKIVKRGRNVIFAEGTLIARGSEKVLSRTTAAYAVTRQAPAGEEQTR